MNNMETLNIFIFANSNEHLHIHETGKRSTRASMAILLSLMIHLFAGWLFLQLAMEGPKKKWMLPIEITMVTPLNQKSGMSLPSLPKKTAHPRSRIVYAPSQQVPVMTPQPVPANEQIVQPPVADKAIVKAATLPALTTTGKSVAGLKQPDAASSRRASVPVSAPTDAAFSRHGAEASQVIGPSYNAAYLRNPAPPYPAAARWLRLQGTATVRVLVSLDGRPMTLRLEKTSGARILDDAALKAVKHWLFVPARHGSEPVAAEIDVPVRFRLN